MKHYRMTIKEIMESIKKEFKKETGCDFSYGDFTDKKCSGGFDVVGVVIEPETLEVLQNIGFYIENSNTNAPEKSIKSLTKSKYDKYKKLRNNVSQCYYIETYVNGVTLIFNLDDFEYDEKTKRYIADYSEFDEQV